MYRKQIPAVLGQPLPTLDQGGSGFEFWDDFYIPEEILRDEQYVKSIGPTTILFHQKVPQWFAEKYFDQMNPQIMIERHYFGEDIRRLCTLDGRFIELIESKYPASLAEYIERIDQYEAYRAGKTSTSKAAINPYSQRILAGRFNFGHRNRHIGLKLPRSFNSADFVISLDPLEDSLTYSDAVKKLEHLYEPDLRDESVSTLQALWAEASQKLEALKQHMGRQDHPLVSVWRG